MRTVLRNALILCLFATATVAAAQSTHSWEQSKLDEFERGTVKGVSIRSDGALELAPAFEQISTTPSTYLWSIASDAEGNVYVAAGAPARVYRITPKGETSVIFAPSELQVQALDVDRDGVIYAATSPDGKVYRIARKPASAASKPPAAPPPAVAQNQPAPRAQVDPSYGSSVFFDPKTKYIWALALDGQGRLYVATGDRGEIFRVEKDGTGSVFFKSDEAHIRAIVFARDGNLIAGSDGSGLVYRITPSGEGFVLYGAPKKEITALALDAQGNIYAGAAGEKRQPAITPLNIPAAGATTAGPIAVLSPATGGATLDAVPSPATSPRVSLIPPPGAGAIGSEIYRIAPDGSPKRIWMSHDDLVYSLTFDRGGRLIAGTGNKGRIYAIDADGAFSDLLRASANQVIGFAPAPHGGIYTATSNLGKVFLMEDTSQREGIYDSDVFDARIFSRWGRAEIRSRGSVELFARSGNVDNPDRNWSHWNKVDLQSGAQTQVPAARYVQWRAVLHSGATAPRVMSVLLNYLPKNVAPEVDDVTVQVGAKPAGMSRAVAEGNGVSGLVSAAPRFDSQSAPPRDRNTATVRWSAHDDNDDQLVFSIYYRGDGDSRWLLLKDDISERVYSFDANLLPDGGYTIRVVASDAPSHPPAEALTGFRDSAHFAVDTTPPHIENLNAAVDNGALRITFSAADSFSDIQRAECSIDAGPWQFVAPVGEISDAKRENYDFAMPLPAHPEQAGEFDTSASDVKRRARHAAPATPEAQQEHIVVVRVYDRADNAATAKAVVRPKP